jgi:hypothetical protein
VHKIDMLPPEIAQLPFAQSADRVAVQPRLFAHDQ